MKYLTDYLHQTPAEIATTFYKCASVNTSTKTWRGYELILSDGKYTVSETLTEGLSYAGFMPVPGNVYSADTMIRVDNWYSGFDIVAGYMWGYDNGVILPDCTTTATATGLSSVDGYYTFGNGAYFDFDESILIGAAPRTFIIHAVLPENGHVSLVDGGTSGVDQVNRVFSFIWGYESNKLGYHLWYNDNPSFIDLTPGDYVIALVYDGTKLDFYIDDTLSGSLDVVLNTGTDYKYRIGQYTLDAEWGGTGSWQSSFGAVYGRALSLQEVSSIVNYVKSKQ